MNSAVVGNRQACESGGAVSDRIAALQKLMKEQGMHAYVIPTEDYHCSEYVGEYFKAREFMSGFTGSAGTLVVLPESAYLWTDGRYFIQAEQQLTGSGIRLMKAGEKGVPTISAFLYEKMSDNDTIGFDAGTIGMWFIDNLLLTFGTKKIHFAGDRDLVDSIWKDRPAMSAEPVWELSTKYTGMSREEKLSMLRTRMEEQKADYYLTAALDEIAWLLNLRGNDVECTPVFLSYMLISKENAELFINEAILSESLKQSLENAGVTIREYGRIADSLKRLPATCRIYIDNQTTNYLLVQSIPKEAGLLRKSSLIAPMKAVKTEAEILHERIAHIKDGVAMTKFMYWLKKNVGKQHITELSAAAYLEKLREAQEDYLGPSFEPIIAYAEHGAIVHYSATVETDVPLQPKGLCLTDTGGHYLDGTTDITRTFALGQLTEEEKWCYTTVLKGHLRLGAACFPYGTTGSNLDILAREPLWEQGLDYRHGTGHGVGYLLNVHEGPQSFQYKRARVSKSVALEEGMITSNEPGLYVEGKFGVRHENLVLCRMKEENEYGRFMYLEPLTMVPFDLDAVEVSLLSERERQLLNAYHDLVRKKIEPFLTGEERAYLIKATSPV